MQDIIEAIVTAHGEMTKDDQILPPVGMKIDDNNMYVLKS